MDLLTRRNLLRTTAAFPALALLPKVRGQSAGNPFPPYVLQQICGKCEELYVKAFIRDPSNTLDNGGTYGGTLPALDNGDGGVLWICQQLDSFCQANGIYNQWWGNGGINSAADVNPSWLKFVANQAQIGLKADYFSLVSPATVCNAFGIPVSSPYASGWDLGGGLQSLMGISSAWQGGNYARLRTPGHVAFLRVRQGSSTTNLAAAGAIGVGMIGGGAAVLNSAGGIGVLTGAVVVGAGAVALAWLGVALMLAGTGIAVYGAYRLLTQQTGDSGPWYTDPPQPGDPPYLHRIAARPALYPPLQSASSEPEYTITI